MERTSINRIKPGQKAGLDIFDQSGKMLVLKGSMLTPAGIEKLKLLKIPHIYTEDGSAKVNTVFETGLMAELMKVIWNFSVTPGSNADVLRVYNLDEIKMFTAYSSEPAAKMAYGHVFKYFASKMCAYLKSTESAYFDFLDYRNIKTYLYYHSAASACISMIIAGQMGLKDKEITDLCIGKLISDLKMNLYNFTTEERELNETERKDMQQHGFLSFEEARNTYGIPSAAAGVAGQHHERVDGSGYPKKLRGESISLISRIAAVADVYDAMLSNRPYRKAYLPDEAWSYIISNKGRLFDESVVDVFACTIAKYLPGDEVVLNDGRHALIESNSSGNMQRPVIKIIEKTGKSDIISDAAIDLSKENMITVVKAIKSARREE